MFDLQGAGDQKYPKFWQFSQLESRILQSWVGTDGCIGIVKVVFTSVLFAPKYCPGLLVGAIVCFLVYSRAKSHVFFLKWSAFNSALQNYYHYHKKLRRHAQRADKPAVETLHVDCSTRQ
jgi:hypothetical protein